MAEPPPPTTRPKALATKDRTLGLGLIAVLAVVFALVGSNVAANHAPKPHEVPLGVIGNAPSVAQVAATLEHDSPGGYRILTYSSLAAARTAVLDRSVYGAYRPGPAPLLLVASAATRAVSNLLEQTFSGAAAMHGHTLVVKDLAPLPSSDPTGATAFSLLLSLILAGELGSVLIFTLGQHRTPLIRLAAIAAMAIGAGLLSVLVTNVIVSAFPGHFLGVWAVAALFVLAIAVPIAGFQALFGVGGTAIGAVLFLVIGNPASGGSSAPELLPGFWRELSQLLPPGAAITALRDVVYFHGHGMTQALLVLAVYVILGIALVFGVSFLGSKGAHHSAPSEPVHA